jgi:phosphate transport system protein
MSLTSCDGERAMPIETEEVSRGPIGPTPDRYVLRVYEELWAKALGLAAVVESALALSVTALCSHRPELAAEVKASERQIDRREVRIEAECMRVLALYEPAASDFRRVLTVLRVNRNLERIGDLAVRIAKRARKLAGGPAPLAIPEPLEALAEGALDAVRDALDALARSDAEAGRAMIAGDRRLDEYQRTVRAGLKESIRREPDRVDDWLRLIDIARHLERVGDHAAGIAEAVVYLKEGQIIRHQRSRPDAP